MIASVTGEVTVIGLDSVVLTAGGLGYAVRTTPQVLTSTHLGRELTLHTELVVREDSLTLFGFSDPAELEVFRTVTTVSGIGPKIALALLAVLTPDQLARAVHGDDAKAITAVPGIGPKVAQRLVLELRDRLGAPAGPAPEPVAPVPAEREGAEVVEALLGLGWPERSARSAVADAVDAEPDAGDAALLRSALRLLGGRR